MVTPPTNVSEVEVLCVHRRLVRQARREGITFIAEYDAARIAKEDVVDIQVPTEPKQQAVLDALSIVAPARARIVRKRSSARQRGRGLKPASVIDDQLRDRAHRKLKEALAAVQSATANLAKHATQVSAELGPLSDDRRDAGAAEECRKVADALRRIVDLTQDLPQGRDTRYAGEWNRAVTQVCTVLSEGGFSASEVSRLVYGARDPEREKKAENRIGRARKKGTAK